MFSTSPRALVVATSVLFIAQAVFAEPMEYVRVCDAFGTGFFYIPGTDTCLNAMTGETREDTEGGTWRSTVGYAPLQWVPNPAAGCLGGTLANVGALGQGAFTFNVYERYEAPLAGVNLGEGDFISTLMMRGSLKRLYPAYGNVRFTGDVGAVIPEGTLVTRSDDTAYAVVNEETIGVDGYVDAYVEAVIAGPGGIMEVGTVLQPERSIPGVDSTVVAMNGFEHARTGVADVCLSFRDANGVYFPLGCESVSGTLNKVATVAFSPRANAPLDDMVAPVTLVASGRDWRDHELTLDGEVSVSACIRNVSADGAVCRVVPSDDASGVTLTCGTTSEKIANGTSCTVAEHGNGTATMTCPDGSSVALLTQAAARASNDDDGCNSAPGSSALLIAAVALFRAIRLRGRSVKL